MTHDLLFSDMRVVTPSKGKAVIKVRRDPSHLQTAILQHRASSATSHLVVRATAGSGKTTMLEMLGEELIQSGAVTDQDRAVFLAFSKDVVDKLRKELPAQLEVHTLNSIGHRIIKENLPHGQFDPKKYGTLINTAVNNRKYARKEARNVRENLQQAVEISMGHVLAVGCPKDEWLSTMNEFGVSTQGMEDDLYALTMEVMNAGMEMITELGTFSYPDQTYAPYHFDWKLNAPYTHLLVDEGQDLTRGQMALVLFSASHDDSRITCVGDPAQAVYQFRGASHNSMDELKLMLGADELPLSVTYRCPRTHVALAAPYTTTIEAAQGAVDGILDDISAGQFISMVDNDDLVLCRTNAPLVTWAYKLAKYGKRSYVLGREISSGMVSFAREASVWDGSRVNRKLLDDDLVLTEEVFLGQLESYLRHLSRKLAEAAAKDPFYSSNEEVTLHDRKEAVRMVYNEKQPQTLGELVELIRELFHKSPDSIKLSSIHKAKGLEAARVFLLEPQLLPHPSAKTPTDLKAEESVQFVAYTRSKHTLLFVEPDETCIPEGLRRALPAGKPAPAQPHAPGAP